ncbi:MAG: putative major facilitator superfamily transporter [Bacteroidota bacterium]|nr:putative major facilitator superfamily transporter [Bacteroidota bacterium]
MNEGKPPLKVLFIYGTGCFGWSISLNLVSVLLNYIYLPPANAGMKNLIPDVAWLGFISIISVILFSGRVVDAIVDPLLSNLSDKSQNKLGRRIPLMRYAFIPLSIFSALMFFPLHRGQSTFNIYWLAGMQSVFYVFYGMYTIPFNALLADMGKDDRTKLNLSSAQSVGFIIGIVVASSCTAVVELITKAGWITDKLTAYQVSIAMLNLIGMSCLGVTAFLLDEKKYAAEAKSTEGVWQALKITMSNHNFRIFVLADATYFLSIAIIAAGLLYYMKSMLKLNESLGAAFMLALVVITMAFYVLVNWLGTKYSKKIMMIIAFSASAIVFSEIFFLGWFPFPPIYQAALLVLTFGVPNAFLQILPNTVIADIAHDASKKGSGNTEGMFFGMRAFFQKIGQTMGVTIFAMLITFGKDPGHDLGLRLSGIAGSVFCIIAALAYSRYKE